MKEYKNIRRIMTILFFVLPIVYGFAIIYKYGVNQPFWDDWNSLALFFSYKEKKFVFADLLKYHNGHCIFFPNIILAVSAILTNGNMKADMYIVMALISIIYVIWILASKQSNSQISILAIMFVAFVTFNSVQYDNILWGFQVGFLLTACTMLGAVFFFSKLVNSHSRKFLILTILFGVVATFSSAQGIIAFLVICLSCVVMSIRKKSVSIEYIAIWASALICLIIYLQGYSSSESSKTIIGIIDFFVTLIGAPVAKGNVVVARVIGSIIVAAVILIVIRGVFSNEFEIYIFEYGTMIMTLGTLAAMALGRSDFGAEYAVITSRYTTFSIWIYEAIVLYLFKKYNKSLIGTVAILIGIIAGVVINTLFYGCYEGVRSSRVESAMFMNNYDRVPLEWLYYVSVWDGYESAYEDIQRYYDAKGTTAKKLFVEVASTQEEADDNKIIWGISPNDFKNDEKFYYTASGWAVGNSEVIEDMHIRIGGKEYQVYYGKIRNDVKSVYNTDPKCGIMFSIAKDEISEGDIIEMVAVMKDGNMYKKQIGVVSYN